MKALSITDITCFAKRYFTFSKYSTYLKTVKSKITNIWSKLTQKHHSNHPKEL